MPYSLNVFSMIAAEVALERRDLLAPLVQAMAAEKDRLAAELAKIPGVHPYPSVANFLLVEVPIPPSLLFARLHERGILVRDLSQSPLLSRHLRISVGTPEENRQLLAALREIILGKGETA
jgi:histidinol-phosphate aminotransferase